MLSYIGFINALIGSYLLFGAVFECLLLVIEIVDRLMGCSSIIKGFI
jgi:hypothetical protein